MRGEKRREEERGVKGVEFNNIFFPTLLVWKVDWGIEYIYIVVGK